MKESFVDLAAVEDSTVRLYVAKGRAADSWVDTRMLILDGKAVLGYHDVKSQITSVDAAPGFSLVALSMDGVVSVATRAGIAFDVIEGPGTGAGRYGYAKSIRCVENTLYACGDMRQIYCKREGEIWTRFDLGLREENPRAIGCSLNHIAGGHGDFLFAIGDRGSIYKLSGDRWTRCPSPTNVNLERALVSRNGDLWTCGAAGTVLRGDGTRWEIFDLGTATLWGLAEFQGAICVCSSEGLYRQEGEHWETIAVDGFRGAPYRLAASGSFLWLLGFNDLMRFDGQAWIRLEC
jgi:hypothetical protein